MNLQNHLLFCLCFIPALSYGVEPEETPINAEEALARVIDVSTNYIKATACEPLLPLSKDNIATLVPWSGEYGDYKGRYLILWQGNLGCEGGTAGHSINITPVNVSLESGSVYVAPDDAYVSGGAQIIIHKVTGATENLVSAEIKCGVPINILKCNSEKPINVIFEKKYRADNKSAFWEVTGKEAEQYFNAQDPSKM